MLTARQLTRRFGGRVAVENLSFDLRRGEILGLLGPNGAGKTTTLRMLAGLIAPSSGTIAVEGHPVDRHNASRFRSRIGFLTEAPGLWERITVRQNLVTYARLYGLPAPLEAVDRVLALFGIADRADDLPAQLSKGLKQRVALARTLVHEPDIVLLDEPTSGLDPGTARTVRETILQLRSEGRSIVVSTHNLDEVERIADRVALLRRTLVAVDTPAALQRELFGDRVRVELRGEADPFAGAVRAACGGNVRAEGRSMVIGAPRAEPDRDIDVPSLVRLLVAAGADIEAVVRERPSLEDVYHQLLERRAGEGG